MEIKKQKTLVAIIALMMLVTGISFPITLIAAASLWWILKQI